MVKEGSLTAPDNSPANDCLRNWQHWCSQALPCKWPRTLILIPDRNKPNHGSDSYNKEQLKPNSVCPHHGRTNHWYHGFACKPKPCDAFEQNEEINGPPTRTKHKHLNSLGLLWQMRNCAPNKKCKGASNKKGCALFYCRVCLQTPPECFLPPAE